MPATVKVFLGWSGPRSHAVATALADWLPAVVQAIDPWISVEMDRGVQWFHVIGTNLKSAKFGMICVTPENAAEQWVLFEAGALALSTSNQLACPYLLDMTPAELKGPLAQLQAAKADKADTWKVLETINGLLEGEARLTEPRLRKAFEQWWPELEAKIDAARKIAVAAPVVAPRSESDKLDEILGIVRELQRFEGLAANATVSGGRAMTPSEFASALQGLDFSTLGKRVILPEQPQGLLRFLAENPREPSTAGTPAKGNVAHKIGKPKKPGSGPST